MRLKQENYEQLLQTVGNRIMGVHDLQKFCRMFGLTFNTLRKYLSEDGIKFNRDYLRMRTENVSLNELKQIIADDLAGENFYNLYMKAGKVYDKDDYDDGVLDPFNMDELADRLNYGNSLIDLEYGRMEYNNAMDDYDDYYQGHGNVLNRIIVRDSCSIGDNALFKPDKDYKRMTKTLVYDLPVNEGIFSKSPEEKKQAKIEKDKKLLQSILRKLSNREKVLATLRQSYKGRDYLSGKTADGRARYLDFDASQFKQGAKVLLNVRRAVEQAKNMPTSGQLSGDPTLFAILSNGEMLQLMEPDEFKKIQNAKSEEEVSKALFTIRALVDL